MIDDFLLREHKIYQIQHIINMYSHELLQEFGKPFKEINLNDFEDRIDVCIETISKII